MLLSWVQSFQHRLSLSEMYAKRKLTEVSLKMKKFSPETPHIMSKPQNRSLTGMGSAASKSGGQNFAQGAELLQNQ